jgi:acyl transferase domain-containing protein/NAD(P)H-dependent flavin oxidoreductase YrpB (nitropropane dioxygenase family)/NAD(P)-dependent dehydrogenase (short-subunit alcohol dehydrogenase family)/acyl carrier protein
MKTDDVIVLTRPGASGAPIIVAGARAGARAFLDLENAADGEAALAAAVTAGRLAPAGFGIRLGDHDAALTARLLAEPPAGWRRVLLGGEGAAGRVASFRAAGIEILVEAVSVAEALDARAAGADGIVLKGHEAGGRIGDETAFVLLQHWLHETKGTARPALPVWVQGGIGLNTSAACLAAGATGVVLDSQLLLSREAKASEREREWLSAFDGSDTVCLGESLGAPYRFHLRRNCPAIEELSALEDRLAQDRSSAEDRLRIWRDAVRARVVDGSLRPLGQDACFAKPLAERFVTVAGIVQAICERSARQLEDARRLRPLAEGAPLATRHSTRYPIVQGPMTRVSDTAPFAASVAEGGGLPFLALALLRGAEVATLLAETRDLAAGKSWGVGVLGFVPAEIRREQVAAILACPPPFALIAGGRPDQAREFEAAGIETYLHVPSPGLLRMFLNEGSRRFVFEGRECGGHVGPRTSFVLWETMCEILLDHIEKKGRADELQVIFAGGIHDALSAAMVSALAAGLAAKGVAIGALMGTAYLFTQEAVAGGAVVSRFQEEALGCGETVLLQTSQGHAIRCIRTPYCGVFDAEKRRLAGEGKSHEEIVKALEWMNMGRLRIASKGVERAAGNGTAATLNGASHGHGLNGAAKPKGGLATLGDDVQYDRGMYMIGQVAAMRDEVTTIARLHEEVSAGADAILEGRGATIPAAPKSAQPPCDIAIIGMSCFFPQASDRTRYWENVLAKRNAITEVPGAFWDWRLYYDPNPRAPDKIISKWGGFLEDLTFDPLAFGITPASMHSIDPLQLYLLESVRLAMADAGYATRPFARDRTCAMLGIGGGASPLPVSYGFRTCLPLLDCVEGLGVSSKEVMERVGEYLPDWTEDSFPGILANVAAGRVANRFNFGGTNYAIDAACGSSLAALQAGIRELESGASDVAFAMAADMVQTPYAYLAFSKTHALSPRGQCRPFDVTGDGIVLSEGIATVVLKRLADAERDGDRIYSVIRGIGSSSDGRAKGLTAPLAEGQLRALRRAYERADISPASVGLVEAHGTGTVAGDHTEAQALGQVFRDSGADPRSCAIGSVKSMIGHSKCAAGIAGLIKTTLALHHKVLPPTLIENPNPKCGFGDGPLYLNGEARPWVHGAETPRRAGVSAFGFGGTNFHVVLEEYLDDVGQEAGAVLRHWPAELLVWRRPSVEAVLEAVEQCLGALAKGATPDLGDLALSLWKADRRDAGQPTLAIVATSLADLAEKLTVARDALRTGRPALSDPRGIHFAKEPAAASGKVAFLFPGQGSQYPNMLGQLAMAFPEVRRSFDAAERRLAGALEKPLGRFVFPPTAFSPEEEEAAKAALTRTEVAQPAVGAADLGMFHLLTGLGLAPDYLAGHSYGEYAALCAAGAIAEEDLPRISHLRGKVIVEASAGTPGSMVAFDATAETVEALIAGTGATLANKNSPRQSVISGTTDQLDAALSKAKAQGVHGQRIAVSRGFHSPLVAGAREPLAKALAEIAFSAPRKPVFSNTTAEAHSGDPKTIAAMLAEHLVAPVRFQDEVEAMYEAGARIFVEVGPQGVLTGLVRQILGDKPHLALASDAKGKPGLVQLQQMLAQLLVCGLPVDLDRLHAGRDLRRLDLGNLVEATRPAKPSPSAWVINSVRVRPIDAPEPIILGAARPDGSVMVSSRTPSTAAKPAVAPATNGAIPPAPAMPAASPRSPASAASPMTSTPPNGGDSLPLPHSDDVTHVMMRYQDLMSRFLDTQRSVMAAYLQGGTMPAGPQIAVSMTAPPAVVAAPPLAVAPQAAAVPAPAIQAAPEPIVVPATAAPAAEIEVSRDWLTAQLLDLVVKRTGYPRDMVRLDLDLEADLGIDSIKRIEILGGMAEAMEGSGAGAGAHLEMEKLASLKTLSAIVDYLERALAPASVPEPSPPAVKAPEPIVAPKAPSNGAAPHANGLNGAVALPKRAGEVKRGRVTLVDAVPDTTRLPILPGVVLFTDDGRGIAREMAGRLADFGQHVALVAHGAAGEGGDGSLHADLTSPQAVDGLLRHVRAEHGRVSGLVHLLPLAEPSLADAPMARMERDVKSLYLLARGLEAELKQGAEEADAICIAATGLGGSLGFGHGPLPAQYFAGHGGVGGFIKSLAYEWPDVLVRTIDLDPATPVSGIVETLIAEMSIPDGPTEIGYAGSRRITWEPVFERLLQGEAATPLLPEGATVLVTGGARGITGAISVELARRYRPNLVITGRSERPAAEEEADLAGATSPAEIKGRLIARMKATGQEVSLPAIEAQYQRLMTDREMRANLAAIVEAGATLEYHRLDGRDREGMTRLLAGIEERYGRVDGVIHAAGVMEDKLLRDKTPESFDRVFGTKAESTVILRDLLKPEPLKFFVLFASTSGRFGNKGQTDYAAGNEILAKTALELDRVWPGRVLAVDWGPWSQIGMSADLEAYMVERGFTLIAPEDGPAMLIDELIHGAKGETEIVIAGAAEEAGRPLRTVRRARASLAALGARLEGAA